MLVHIGHPALLKDLPLNQETLADFSHLEVSLGQQDCSFRSEEDGDDLIEFQVVSQSFTKWLRNARVCGSGN